MIDKFDMSSFVVCTDAGLSSATNRYYKKNEKYLFADEKTEGVTCNQKVYKSPESRCQSGLRDFFCQKTVKLGILSALSSIEC